VAQAREVKVDRMNVIKKGCARRPVEARKAGHRSFDMHMLENAACGLILSTLLNVGRNVPEVAQKDTSVGLFTILCHFVKSLGKCWYFLMI
jgi:hypothetical protein